jgi:type IV pilus assembly protein PilM
MLNKALEKLRLRPFTELLGVDIGTTSIKVCVLKKTKDGIYLQKYAKKSYDKDLLHDGTIVDGPFVGRELKHLLQEENIKVTTAATALSSYTVITKRVTMPLLDEETLSKSIGLEVESVIPYPLRDIYYNYYLMGTEEDKEAMMSLLIVAAKKEIVDAYMNVFRLAGLNLLILDVDIFAVTNLVERIHSPQQFSVVAADIGASVTNIAILKNETIEFTREILIGGKYLTNEIAKAHKISHEEAEEKKLQAGGDVSEFFDDFVGNISSEMNKTVNFYVATKPRETVGKIYLTGGSSLVPGLKERIESETGIEVAFLDPSMCLQQQNGKSVRLGEGDQAFAPVALYLSSRVSDLEP